MYRGKPIGARFEQMVSKTTRIVNSVRDWHVPFAQFTLIYREPGTSLAIGPGPGTGRKKNKKKQQQQQQQQFSVQIFRFGLPRKTFPLFLEIFRLGKPK